MNDNYPVWPCVLEIRARGDKPPMIRASFPYNKTATMSNRGRVRKERFRSGSMSWQVREFQKLQAQFNEAVERGIEAGKRDALEDALEKRNTHLLVGHSYDHPIADMRSGTLVVAHSDDAVLLEATLPEEHKQPSWVRDAVLAIEGQQLRGISPGFVVTSKGSERIVPEEDGPSMVREIEDAVVFEYSLVSRPAYPGTEADVREMMPLTGRMRPRRWHHRRLTWL